MLKVLLLNINDDINNTLSLLEFINKKDKVVKLNIINEDQILKESHILWFYINLYRKPQEKQEMRIKDWIILAMKDYQKIMNHEYNYKRIFKERYKEIAEWLDELNYIILNNLRSHKKRISLI